jgi:hypothetical protein
MGRDLQGHWWSHDRAAALPLSFRAAQRFVREINYPRRLRLEREATT